MRRSWSISIIHRHNWQQLVLQLTFPKNSISFFFFFLFHLTRFVNKCKHEKDVCSVVGPGFPRGGPPTPKGDGGSANLLFCKFFAENCMKMKELVPGGVRSWRPLLDPPLKLACCTYVRVCVFVCVHTVVDIAWPCIHHTRTRVGLFTFLVIIIRLTHMCEVLPPRQINGLRTRDTWPWS